MGQGLNVKMLGVAMRELGLLAAKIRLMATSTDKVPNTSPTAASSGADLNGAAVRNACEILRERLRPVAAELLGMEGKLGCIAPGAFADLLVVDGDPLKDVAVLGGQGERLAAIMKNGEFAKNDLS
jgi:imidazolonepropionase-like amidohydrolase